jgi:hypothetical protein
MRDAQKSEPEEEVEAGAVRARNEEERRRKDFCSGVRAGLALAITLILLFNGVLAMIRWAAHCTPASHTDRCAELADGATSGLIVVIVLACSAAFLAIVGGCMICEEKLQQRQPSEA